MLERSVVDVSGYMSNTGTGRASGKVPHSCLPSLAFRFRCSWEWIGDDFRHILPTPNFYFLNYLSYFTTTKTIIKMSTSLDALKAYVSYTNVQ